MSFLKAISASIAFSFLIVPIATADNSVFVGQPEMIQSSGAGEGPVWHPQLGLLTSGDGNINRRALDNSSHVFRDGAGSNGLLFDRQGRLVICENVNRRVTRLEADGKLTVLADSYDGMKFNQPNDLTIDSKNRIYFTDPQYGDRSNMQMLDANGKHVEGIYRIDLDGTVTRIITHEVDRPNGLIITPDDKYLYVADNNNGLGGARKLWRFDMRPDGTPDLASQKMLYDWQTTRGPDGMKLDLSGRLYVAAGLNEPRLPEQTATPPTAGIYVFMPDGKQVAFAPILQDETTNCAFGGPDGKTLFVTAGGTLWSIPTAQPGYQIQ
ncbi:Gluconolactonase precursor [Rubripirellula reticaptiva]|uniref:Gluconolactonase n=1 Tax=Rubripirellula reticaptiva TaxID=2528013 RepID=A0A5C6ET57_9BACT|nr:Gluconolactonase precursor [Rubripirellula reticaptiva]